MELTGLTVVLVGDANNPPILNPDFLERNVLPSRWEQRDAPICTPVFARVSYRNGVSVQSEPNRVIFAHQGRRLSTAKPSVAHLAQKYLEAVPHVLYKAVGINPAFVLAVAGRPLSLRELVRSDLQLEYNEVSPACQIKVVYALPTKRVTIDMTEFRGTEAARDEEAGVLFQGNIHREIEGATPANRAETLDRILNGCASDVHEFSMMVRTLNLFSTQDA